MLRSLCLLSALALASPSALAQPATLGGTHGGGAPSADEFVVLTTGDTLYGEVHLDVPPRDARYVVVDGERVSLNRVRAMHLDEGTYGILWRPNTHRPQVLTLAGTGRLDVYAYEVEDGDLAYVQTPSGEFVMANTRNLRPLLADDPAALAHLDRASSYKTIALVATVVGAGLMAYGAVVEFTDIPGNSVYFGGAGLALGVTANLGLQPMRDRERRRALEAYNGN